MSEHRPSRRTILKGAITAGATAALFALPATALEQDPVFEAIAVFRARRTAFNAVLKEQGEHEDVCWARGESDPMDTAEGEEIDARRDAASDADADAWWNLLNTAPTTRDGLCALLAMLTDKDGYGGRPFPTIEEIEAFCGSIRAFVMRGAS